MTTTTASKPGSLPPSYPSHEQAPSSCRSSISLPPYTDGAPTQPNNGFDPSSFAVPTTFAPTQRLRIDAQGHGCFRLPFPPKPDPIPVYDVTHGDPASPLYVSLRSNRNSGTCRLVRGGDGDTVCTTTYRFGPGNPPVIGLLADGPPSYEDEGPRGEEVVIESLGPLTRAQVLRSRLGTFRWRYASSEERKAQGQDSVIILEKLTAASTPHTSKKEEVATEIGLFARGHGTRTPGTTKHTAGNGGLLLLNLAEWRGEKKDGEEEEVRALIVASCLSMLKKEIDRRRALQMAVILGGGGS
ncbi:hypothetical protein VUR80DRAFT_1872 [Thermomyces stellatus]